MSEKRDLKKELKALYSPPAAEVREVEVPRLRYLMVDGQGDPNTSPEYQEAVEALYALSYGLKFALKKQQGLDYTVMPLEGLWWTEKGTFDVRRKGELKWTALIAQPEQVTEALFEQVRGEVRKKKPLPALDRVRLEEYAEGRCVQVLHVGPYSEEPATIDKLHRHAAEKGYTLVGRHHEIYLSDPRKTAPEKLKTVIRQPIK